MDCAKRPIKRKERGRKFQRRDERGNRIDAVRWISKILHTRVSSDTGKTSDLHTMDFGKTSFKRNSRKIKFQLKRREGQANRRTMVAGAAHARASAGNGDGDGEAGGKRASEAEELPCTRLTSEP